MNVTIIAVGSHGDVQPYVALGLGLKAAGHHVQVATHSNFHDFVISWGLAFAEVKGNPREWLEKEEGLAWIESGPGMIGFYQGLKKFMEPVLDSLLPTSFAACRESDVILYSSLAVSGPHIAEKLKRPGFPLMLQPVYPTGDFPSVIANVQKKTGRLFNHLTHLITDQILHHSTRERINQWRRESLGLPPAPLLGNFRDLRKRKVPHFLGYSKSVVPRPSAWDDHVHVTGYWFVNRPPDWQPPSDLLSFLESGPRPVYVGFGSIPNRKPKETTSMIIRALEMANQRAVLLSGWGKLGAEGLPKTIFRVESVPHDWLFPQVSAVIHHGGAGTTAAGLRADRPSILTPFFADQFFWAQRVVALGVGPKTIPYADLNAEDLAMAIKEALTNSSMIERARDLGRKIRSENGVEDTVAILQQIMHCN